MFTEPTEPAAVTRFTPLAVTNEPRLRTAVTAGNGSMMVSSDARMLCAQSAPSTRAGGDDLARMMRKNPGENRRTRTIRRADVRTMSDAAIQSYYTRAALKSALRAA